SGTSRPGRTPLFEQYVVYQRDQRDENMVVGELQCFLSLLCLTLVFHFHFPPIFQIRKLVMIWNQTMCNRGTFAPVVYENNLGWTLLVSTTNAIQPVRRHVVTDGNLICLGEIKNPDGFFD